LAGAQKGLIIFSANHPGSSEIVDGCGLDMMCRRGVPYNLL
jgi:hypothetical protein